MTHAQIMVVVRFMAASDLTANTNEQELLDVKCFYCS